MYSLRYSMITMLLVMVCVKASPTFTLKSSVINSIIDNNQRQMPQNNTVALSTLAPILSSSSSSSSLLSLSTASVITTTNNLRLRKRHRKRHSIWLDYNSYNENSTILEWSNPCGGEYHPNAKQPKRPTKKEQKKIYNTLRHAAINDFNYLNGSYQQDIDISNIAIWFLHNGTYKFLPKLKLNSSIALLRWHRNMKTYLASFAYLYHIQLKYDRSKSQRESKTCQELKELLRSSTSMLCELETAVNKTYPAKNRSIPHITRLQMNKRLKLRTKQRFRDNADILAEADSIDLKFVKFHYFEYLKSMWQILKKYNKHMLQSHKQQNQHKITHQTSISQQQFNEVDKLLQKQQTKRNKKRKNSKTKHRLVNL